MVRFILVLSLTLPLAACAVAWGAPYQVTFTSSSSITISYDDSLIPMGRVQNVAQEHCRQYHKDAIPQDRTSSPWGFKEISFKCVKRVESAPLTP